MAIYESRFTNHFDGGGDDDPLKRCAVCKCPMINTLQSLAQLHIYQLTASPECPFPNHFDGWIHFNMRDISWNIIRWLPRIKEGLVAVHDGIGCGTVYFVRGLWWWTDEARPPLLPRKEPGHEAAPGTRQDNADATVSSERRPFFGCANAVAKSSSWLSSSFMADDVIIVDQSAAASSSSTIKFQTVLPWHNIHRKLDTNRPITYSGSKIAIGVNICNSKSEIVQNSMSMIINGNLFIDASSSTNQTTVNNGGRPSDDVAFFVAPYTLMYCCVLLHTHTTVSTLLTGCLTLSCFGGKMYFFDTVEEEYQEQEQSEYYNRCCIWRRRRGWWL